MFSFLNSIFIRKEREVSYLLDDKWEPDFACELKLAVSCFYTDDAFHRVFGEGRRLNEKSVLWHFIGLLISRRSNSARTIVSVRKDKSLISFVAGTLFGRQSEIGDLINTVKQEYLLNKITKSKGKKSLFECYQEIRDFYGAVEDEQMEVRIKQYFDQIRAFDDLHKASVFYMITMIAVDHTERGRGHLRDMLDCLVFSLKKNSQAEFILVSTYDKSKAELYEHLGFSKLRVAEANHEQSGWVLKLPISR